MIPIGKMMGAYRVSPNLSTAPITAMGCWQCLPLSVVQLKGKYCRKPPCHNGVVDTLCVSPFNVLTLLFLISFWLALVRLRNGYDITDIPVAQ